MDDPYKENIKLEIIKRCDNFNLKEIESVLKDLVNETKINFYNIKIDKIDTHSIKSIMFISNIGCQYEISFKNIKIELREIRLNAILDKNKNKNKNKIL